MDPPTIEAADDMTIMCSTECPDANGQIWDSPSGTWFRMHCCKRHGVKAFAVEQMSSLKECMAGCARIPACQFVDYQKETGKCYMGKHSGEPTIQVAGWVSAHSMGCAGACKEKEGCCGCGDGLASGDFMGRPAVGQSTGARQWRCKQVSYVYALIKVSIRYVFSSFRSPPGRCGNQGIPWAEYPNTQGDNSGTGKYENFNPALYKNQIPHSEGITSTAGGIDALGGERITVYGSSVQFDGDYFAVDHKGYIFAPTTGTYKLTMSQVDDTVFLWFGSNAQSGWTRSNAALIVNLGSDTATVDLTAGQYLPIRIMFAQGQGKASFKLSIEAPDGSVLVDSNTQQNPHVVHFSCDRVSAPRFSDWGVEA
ncbi:putative PA14 domain-containing protein [Seiridium unicorne]|uniref:PA14 domain-containing protein n=1 Tax=Seiridium unicorne TaxID=138068 RepID=A0ABR2UQ27_9PEZI